MKKVLLLGDSIRLSYQPHVKEKLSEIVEVVGAEENCRFAKYTLWGINTWINELGKTGAEIIWATTTPVNNKNLTCRNDEIDRYNAVIADYMRNENIIINDLNTLHKGDIDLYIQEDHLHLSEKRQLVCSEAVVIIFLVLLTAWILNSCI